MTRRSHDHRSDPGERDAILRCDLGAFLEGAMAELEPNNPFKVTWYHRAILSVLENSAGKKVRTVINAPPRSLKSIILSVSWVAYVLGHDPTHKFICVSYSRDLAEFHAALCRRLMHSTYYRRLFPQTRLSKVTDGELITTSGGFRIATSVGAS
jgi:hypothetical protein